MAHFLAYLLLHSTFAINLLPLHILLQQASPPPHLSSLTDAQWLPDMYQSMLRCLEPALTLDGQTSANERKKRTLFLQMCSVGVFLVLWFLAASAPVLHARILTSVACIISVFIFTISISLVLLKYRLSDVFVVAMVYGASLCILCWDLNSRTKSSSSWPLLVICVDCLLIMELPARYSVGLVVFTCLWLLLTAVEESLRFGLFELPGLTPQEGAYSRREFAREMVECATLPCPVRFPPSPMFMSLSVFIIDFLATRSFASQVLKEQAAMERTISVVQEIASLLAKYDVEGVAEMLKVQRDELPEEMHATLRRMEENLRKYRPYLPAALFEEEGGAPSASVPPPVLENDVGTIVFTDIRSSTSIWECAPEGMRAGLKIHNAVLREVMQVFGGYEVKTIGDAFMVAFASTADGVNFGLQVQEYLREANWPASLLEEAPICAEQGPLWGGLTVRIGVNSGPVTVEQNTLTGRTDYFGHTVNIAARLESTCTPGAVAVPCDLWTSVCGLCTAVAGEAEALDLKGVSQPMRVRCLWPASLAGRAHNPLADVDMSAHSVAMSVGGCGMSVKSLGSSPQGSLGSENSAIFRPQLGRQVTGTVGVVDIEVGDESALKALHTMNAGLATLTITLDQSGGSLVTLLGSCVCVGWNVTRSAPAHMENAVRFAQRMMAKTAYFKGAGVVSGPVQHGDIGSHKQRFVTVLGHIVRRSWTLCEEAVREGGTCLYEPDSTTLPSALEDTLVQHKGGGYRVVQESRDRVECI